MKYLIAIILCGFLQNLHAQSLDNQLLITSIRTGDTEVFIVNPTTGDAFNLTKAPQSEERYPSWSPDGQKVVFTSNREDGKTYNLYIVNKNGKGLRKLTSLPAGSVAYWASWTADGKHIYFNEGSSSSIYRVKPNGSDLQKITEGRDGNISPDGKKIVFTQQGKKGYGVWVMDANGQNRKQIIEHESEIGGIAPVWSPDGKKIAFSGQDGEYAEIFVCDAEGNNLTQLTKLKKISSSPAFSPDNSFISFRVTDVAYWREDKTRNQAYTEKQADKRPVYLMKSDGSEVKIIEVLHYQCAIDGSRAEWQPK
jgi:TolB protein